MNMNKRGREVSDDEQNPAETQRRRIAQSAEDYLEPPTPAELADLVRRTDLVIAESEQVERQLAARPGEGLAGATSQNDWLGAWPPLSNAQGGPPGSAAAKALADARRAAAATRVVQAPEGPMTREEHGETELAQAIKLRQRAARYEATVRQRLLNDQHERRIESGLEIAGNFAQPVMDTVGNFVGNTRSSIQNSQAMLAPGAMFAPAAMNVADAASNLAGRVGQVGLDYATRWRIDRLRSVEGKSPRQLAEDLERAAKLEAGLARGQAGGSRRGRSSRRVVRRNADRVVRRSARRSADRVVKRSARRTAKRTAKRSARRTARRTAKRSARRTARRS